MPQEITIIDPAIEPAVQHLREKDRRLFEGLTRKKKIAFPETGVKLVVGRDFENRTTDVPETGVYVFKTGIVLLRATIYQICTVAGSGVLHSTLTWTARTSQPAPPVHTFSPPDVDLTVYGEAQYGEVLLAGAGTVTFKAEIVGGAGEYSAYLRLEKVGL